MSESETKTTAQQRDALMAQLAAKDAVIAGLVDALELIYDKYEDGDPCTENGDPDGSMMGNCVQLHADEEDKILAALEAAGVPTALTYSKRADAALAAAALPESKKGEHANG